MTAHNSIILIEVWLQQYHCYNSIYHPCNMQALK